MTKKSSGKLIQALNLAQSEDPDGLLDELNEGSDRATAILGGVFLDERLRELVVNFFVDDPRVLDSLFGVEMPLATFSARIKIAFGLGLISKSVYEDLNRIRHIRNSFAHGLHGLSFSHSDISSWCNELEVAKDFIISSPDLAKPRLMYILAILHLAGHIRAEASNIKQYRRVASSDSPSIHFIRKHQ